MVAIAVVVIAVPVMVTVAIAVSVTVAVAFGAVEYDGHVLEFLLFVDILQLGQEAAVQQAGADDEDGAVCVLLDNLRIGQHLYGRAVDDEVVILGLELGDGVLQAGLIEQLGGVGRDGAHRQQLQGVVILIGDEHLMNVGDATVEVVTEALLGGVNVRRGGAVAQVAVNDQHALAFDGEGHGDVHAKERLAAAGVERGEQDDVAGGIGVGHELQVGAEHAEGFVDDVTRAFFHHHFSLVLGLALVEPAGLVGRLVGYLAHKGEGEAVEVLAASHHGVGALLDEDDDHGDEQAQRQGNQEDVLLDGSGGRHGAAGQRDDAGVVGGEGLREFVLLTLLQQVEVEGFLHFLLALHAEQVLGLVGVGGDARGGLVAVVLLTLDLCVQGHQLVVNGLYQVGTVLGQVLVHLFHQGVALATLGDQAVALQQLGIVSGDLAVEVLAAEAVVEGEQLIAVALAAEVVADIPGHVHLVVELGDAEVGTLGLGHVHAYGSFYIGQHVLTLVGGDVIVYIAQLVLDDVQSVIDEHGGADGHLVAVFHPALVIHGDEGVEHILGTLDVEVDHREGQDAGAVVIPTDGEGAGIASGRGAQRGVADVDGLLEAFVVGLGGGDYQGAQRGAHGVVDGALDLGIGLLAAPGKVEGGVMAVAMQLQGERGVLVIQQIGQADADGQRGAVEGGALEVGVGLIVVVESKAGDDFGHQFGGLQDAYLIADVDVGLEHAQVGELFHAAGAAFGIVLDEDGGGAGEHGRGGHQIEGGQAEAYHEGKQEPFPPGQTEIEDVLHSDGVLGVGTGC